MRDRALRQLVGVTAVFFGTVIATEGLAVSYAHQLGRGDVTTGLLTAAVPAGSAVGLLVVRRIPPARRITAVRVLSVLWPLPLMATLLRPNPELTFGLWFGAGAIGAFQLLGNLLFATGLNPATRGRAFAFAQSSSSRFRARGCLQPGLSPRQPTRGWRLPWPE